METFKYHPDNMIIITQNDFVYLDALDRFTFDCAKCGLDLIPEKPANIREYFANKEEPNRSFAILAYDCSQVLFEETGHQPDEFFIYIMNIEMLLEAKRHREHPAKEVKNG